MQKKHRRIDLELDKPPLWGKQILLGAPAERENETCQECSLQWHQEVQVLFPWLHRRRHEGPWWLCAAIHDEPWKSTLFNWLSHCGVWRKGRIGWTHSLWLMRLIRSHQFARQRAQSRTFETAWIKLVRWISSHSRLNFSVWTQGARLRSQCSFRPET